MFKPAQIVEFYNRLSFFLKFLAVVFLIFGARLWLIKLAGVAIPHYDEWDVGFSTISPWIQGTLSLSSLFSTHGEHPIVLTRLLILLLIQLNGQWDPLLEMTVNAVIYTLTAVIMVFILRNVLGKTLDNWLLLGIAIIGVVPFAWINILWGFQSCWYFLLLFTFPAMWGLLLHDHFTRPWWLGICSGTLACLNLASGFFALVVVVILKSYLMVVNRERSKEHLITLTISTILICLFSISFLLAPKHDTLYSRNLYEFLTALGKFLAWPWVDYPWLSLLVYLPFFTLIAGIVWRNQKPERSELFILAIGIWVITQILAAAFARGAGSGAHPIARYWELISFGILANLLCFYILTQPNFGLSVFKRYIWIFANIWGLLIFVGMFDLMVANIPAIQHHQNMSKEYVNFTRTLLRNNYNLKAVVGYHSPYSFREQLVHFLALPGIRDILPFSLTITPEMISNQNDKTFVEEGLFGSYVQDSCVEFDRFSKSVRFDDNYHCSVHDYQEWVISSYGKGNMGRFVSDPIYISQPFMEMMVAGYLGESDLSLQLVTDDQKIPITAKSSKIIEKKWHPIYLKTPAKPFKIIAIDNRSDLWLAFSAPRGIGVLSFYNSQLLNHGQSIFLFGLLLLGIVLALIRQNGIRMAPLSNLSEGVVPSCSGGWFDYRR